VGLRFQYVDDACRCFVRVREMDFRLRLGFECYLMPPGYVPRVGGDDRDAGSTSGSIGSGGDQGRPPLAAQQGPGRGKRDREPGGDGPSRSQQRPRY